ncbi:hypothetical protein ABBQ38_002115 [Trebouxia sp. C0009 RCD-2024]
MLTPHSSWTLQPLTSWAGAHTIAITSTWGPQAWTLGSTGASSVLVFFVLFKLSPYLSNASTRTYSSLGPRDKIDWDSRVSSTLHAFAISALAAYLIVWSDSFSDKSSISEPWKDPPLKRHTQVSSAALGLSVGYFMLDITLIIRHFPWMGGPEMLIHHIAAFMSVALASFTGQAHLYTLLLLSTELTTPFVNARWVFDQMGWRSARIYTVNGVCLFASWLFARIVLFLWFFKHMWEHRSDIAELRTHVMVLILTVPPLLFVLNVFWFGKIVRGLIKLLTGQLAKNEDLSPRIINFTDAAGRNHFKPVSAQSKQA